MRDASIASITRGTSRHGMQFATRGQLESGVAIRGRSGLAWRSMTTAARLTRRALVRDIFERARDRGGVHSSTTSASGEATAFLGGPGRRSPRGRAPDGREPRRALVWLLSRGNPATGAPDRPLRAEPRRRPKVSRRKPFRRRERTETQPLASPRRPTPRGDWPGGEPSKASRDSRDRVRRPPSVGRGDGHRRASRADIRVPCSARGRIGAPSAEWRAGCSASRAAFRCAREHR